MAVRFELPRTRSAGRARLFGASPFLDMGVAVKFLAIAAFLGRDDDT